MKKASGSFSDAFVFVVVRYSLSNSSSSDAGMLLIAEPSVVQLTESLGNAAQGLPFTVIVDKTGVISRVKVGMLSETDLDTTLGRLTRP